MRAAICLTIFLFLVPAALHADDPAIEYFVVKTVELKKLIPDGDLKKLDREKLDELAVAQGYFMPPCTLWLKTKDYQFRIEAEQGKQTLTFSLSMYSQKSRSDVFSCEGEVEIKEEFTVKKGWEEGAYVILFKWVNLLE